MTIDGVQAPTRSGFDVEPLTRSVDHAAVRAIRAAGSQLDRADLASVTKGALISSFITVLLAVGIPLTVAGLPFMVATIVWPDWSAYVCVLVGVVVMLGIGIPLGRWRWKVTKREWQFRPSWTHRWRMKSMAQANELAYQSTMDGMPLGTVLHNFGGNLWDVFTDRGGSWFGNARAKGDSVQMLAPFGWSFIAVRLPTHVPHMMMVPAAGSVIPLRREQRLKLEGDFDRWFHLYAPADYARDALYVITPDLMALLIDQLPGSYVETIDGVLVITSPRPNDFSQAQAWDRVGKLLDTVVPKTVRQTRRYRDSRSDVLGQVAPAGRRLRMGVSIAGVIALLFFILQIVRIIAEAAH